MPLKPFTTRDLTIVGQGYDVNISPFRFLRLLSVSPSTANIQVKLAEPRDNGAFFPFGPDARIERPLSEPEIPKLSVKSDTANTVVTFLYSPTDRIVQDALPAAAPGGAPVVVVSPLNSAGQVSVGGPQAFGYNGPVSDSDNPLPISMQWDRGGGTFEVTPFTSLDGEALVVGPGSSAIPGFLFGPGAVPVRGYATLRIQIAAAGAGALTALDDYGNKLPIYNADDGLNVGNAGITAANNTGYYIPVAGARNVTIAGDAGYSYWQAFSPIPFTPTKQ